jgi:hypothetical protein
VKQARAMKPATNKSRHESINRTPTKAGKLAKAVKAATAEGRPTKARMPATVDTPTPCSITVASAEASIAAEFFAKFAINSL